MKPCARSWISGDLWRNCKKASTSELNISLNHAPMGYLQNKRKILTGYHLTSHKQGPSLPSVLPPPPAMPLSRPSILQRRTFCKQKKEKKTNKKPNNLKWCVRLFAIRFWHFVCKVKKIHISHTSYVHVWVSYGSCMCV